MKYRCQVEIDLPIQEVVNLWRDERYFPEWQDGFQSITLLDGKFDEAGTTSRIIFEQGKTKMELKETILLNNLPKEKKALYEHIHMTNTQTSRFEALADNRTRYISEVEYTAFHSFMPKLMAYFFPGMFKKQSMKWMSQFKAFAEKHKTGEL